MCPCLGKFLDMCAVSIRLCTSVCVCACMRVMKALFSPGRWIAASMTHCRVFFSPLILFQRELCRFRVHLHPALSPFSLLQTHPPSFFFFSSPFLSDYFHLHSINPFLLPSLPFSLFHFHFTFTFPSCVPLCPLSQSLSVCQGMNNWGVLSLVSRWWDGCYGSICAL